MLADHRAAAKASEEELEAYGHIKENVLKRIEKSLTQTLALPCDGKQVGAEGDIICLLDKRLSSTIIGDQGGTSRAISSSALASHVTDLTVKCG